VNLKEKMNEIPTLHVPVMLSEMLTALSPRAGAIYVDGTFGIGGYSRAILEAAQCQVVGIDRDPAARPHAELLVKEYPGRFKFIQGRFGNMKDLLENIGLHHVDGIVLDLGVSSPQLDQGERGFSFMHNGPLDMRMEQIGQTAAEVVNTFSEEDLANILWQFADESKSRLIARRIVAARAHKSLTTTTELKGIIHEALKRKGAKIDPATKTFQALRIFVNDELNELKQGLEMAKDLLNPSGRLVVVTFHSTEDKIVKSFMRKYSGHTVKASRHHPPTLAASQEIHFEMPQRKSLVPSLKEIKFNIRSRSSRLRWVSKIQ